MKVANNSSSNVPHRHPEMVDDGDKARKVWTTGLYFPPTSQSVNPLPLTSHILTGSPLVKEGELTPGISAREYESRRQRLMQTLPDNSLVVLMGGKVKYMSNRTSHNRCPTSLRPHHVEARDIVCRAV